MSHWSSELPVSFPSWGDPGSIPRGYLCETRILLLALSRYIGTFLFFYSWNAAKILQLPESLSHVMTKKSSPLAPFRKIMFYQWLEHKVWHSTQPFLLVFYRFLLKFTRSLFIFLMSFLFLLFYFTFYCTVGSASNPPPPLGRTRIFNHIDCSMFD